MERILSNGDFGLDLPAPPIRAEIKHELIRNLIEQMGRDPNTASPQDWFYALAYFLRGRFSSARIRTWRRNSDHHAKWIYYLSLEFLPGRLLKTCLISQGVYEVCSQALADLNVDLVVEGTIQRMGTKVRVLVHAHRMSDAKTLHSGKHDGDLEDLFGLQDRIADSISNVFVPQDKRQVVEGTGYVLVFASEKLPSHLKRLVPWKR